MINSFSLIFILLVSLILSDYIDVTILNNISINSESFLSSECLPLLRKNKKSRINKVEQFLPAEEYAS